VADISESIEVAPSPLEVYEQVSELSRMAEWSPECTGVRWSTSGVPGVGSRFIGLNRAGVLRWFTQGEVVEAVPGERFSFRIAFGPVPVALWTYEFAATGVATGSGLGTGLGSGCTVTESWTDRRPAALRRAFGWIFGDRVKINRYGIHQTLGNLKVSLESVS
jgi:uncharacterized protein YndB with AHSA1/START domain